MKFKYQRTAHLPFSEGCTSDDKKLTSVEHFYGKEIIMTEKRDGENSTIAKNYTHARSLNSVDHPSRHWLKNLHGTMGYNIPEDWRVCGENLYAKHSISYNDLNTYFEVFSIWNEKNICLSFDETLDWCELLGLNHVPVLWRGIFDEQFLKDYKLDLEKQEGFVIRLADSFRYEDFYTSVAKWVRENHVTTSDHWMYEKMEINKIK